MGQSPKTPGSQSKDGWVPAQEGFVLPPTSISNRIPMPPVKPIQSNSPSSGQTTSANTAKPKN